jgi:nucleoside-diphosphate-sugar epimerase
VREGSSTKYLAYKDIRIVEFDFSSRRKISDTLREIEEEEGRIDFIIHNAGITKAKKQKEYIEVNTDYTSNFIAEIKKTLKYIPKFVYISSLAAYGPGNSSTFLPVKNSDTPGPITAYGKSKYLAEQIITAQATIPWIIIRPTAVYGPKEKEIFAVFKMVNIGFQPGIKNDRQRLSFIYVTDLVRAILDITISSNQHKAYFISDGHIYTNKEFGEYVKEILGKKTFKIDLSQKMMKGIAYILELIYQLKGETPGFNREKVDEMSQLNWLCDTQPLLADIGFIPEYDLKKGIAESIAWYKKEKWL